LYKLVPVEVFKNVFGIEKKGFDFIIDEGQPPVKGVLPFSDDYFQFVGYSAKGGVNVELEVEYDKGTGGNN